MDALRKAGDSCGARIRVTASKVPVGLGEPLFDKMDADIAWAMMGINAVKGVEIGAGFASVTQRGTAHGDSITPEGFETNNAGGMLGGITHRAGPRGQHRDQADQLDHQPAPLGRRRQQAGRGRHQGPARPLRRHPRDADRRGDAGAGGDGACAAQPRAVRRREGTAGAGAIGAERVVAAGVLPLVPAPARGGRPRPPAGLRGAFGQLLRAHRLLQSRTFRCG